MPHILLTQAESFCNIHRFAPGIEDDIFPHILKAMSQGRHGRLELDWSGAYTMRTEFSILTGLDLRRLETFGFDPYLLAARHPVASLAHTLGKLGYRSICIHPYDPTFFNRNRVMRHFGFNQFIGQEAFSTADTNGPYVSDPSVLNMALDLMQDTSEPLFVFVITMEAHGPWLPDRFGANNAPETPLTHYLRHLRSLDSGVGNVLTRSQKLHRDMIFALYGDHVPSLDIVHKAGTNSRATDYFVWSSCQYPLRHSPRNLRPECLGNEIIHALNEITSSGKKS
jgi:phosphoglycerol transferase MdoB-like AlkP superfamily enzyme